MKIGIIGLGFVGDAIYKGLKTLHKPVKLDVLRIDPFRGFYHTYDELKDADGVFVCVPSPMNEDGSADTRILESVIDQLRSVDYKNVIISKVTAPPDVYSRLASENENLVHVPEFLTASNAFYEYLTGKNIIIGGNASYADAAQKIVALSKNDVTSIHYCSIVEASLIKYAINTFLATKVVFFNELRQLALESHASWEKVRKGIVTDKRIGESHTHVPGPDGSLGYGGLCFPKDVAAFVHYAKSIGQNMTVLEQASRENEVLRNAKSLIYNEFTENT